jgi:hypothetical protein
VYVISYGYTTPDAVSVTVQPHEKTPVYFPLTSLGDVPPILGTLTVPTSPVLVNTPVNAYTTLTHPNNGQTFTAVWTWGDGQTTSMSLPVGTNAFESNHSYTAPGMYTVSVKVTDSSGKSATVAAQSFVVVYNTKGGSVLAAGTFKSPAGAYVAKPTVAGTGAFGVAAGYLNGKTNPQGLSDFYFNDTGFNFYSSNYQWLAVNGANAWLQGTGTANGKGNYTFLASMTDGALVGKSVPDKFRIQIWNTATNALVYDNQAGAAKNAIPTTALTKGTIVIAK